MLGAAYFRGAHGPRLGDAPPPSSQACEPACPGPLPADLTWHQEESSQPARHARRPSHGPVRQPRGCPRPSRNLRRAARPLPFGSLRPQPHRGPEGGLKLSALRSHPGLQYCPLAPLGFLSPPVFPSVSFPWWVGVETLSFYIAETSPELKRSSCLSFPAVGQLLFFGSLSVPCFSPRKHHFSKVLSPKF